MCAPLLLLLSGRVRISLLWHWCVNLRSYSHAVVSWSRDEVEQWKTISEVGKFSEEWDGSVLFLFLHCSFLQFLFLSKERCVGSQLKLSVFFARSPSASDSDCNPPFLNGNFERMRALKGSSKVAAFVSRHSLGAWSWGYIVIFWNFFRFPGFFDNSWHVSRWIVVVGQVLEQKNILAPLRCAWKPLFAFGPEMFAGIQKDGKWRDVTGNCIGRDHLIFGLERFLVNSQSFPSIPAFPSFSLLFTRVKP
jgi:hypothetical protein